MADIVIYTKSYCPFSKKAKLLLDSKGALYDEKVIDGDEALETEMHTKSGMRQDTPQIFIDGHHIGSGDDLQALEDTGKLDSMLQ